MALISPTKAGIVLAALLGTWHLLWSLVVALGWAQAVIDFVLWMHFLRPVYVVGEFKLSTALVLIGVSTSIGYATGFVLAVLWNRLHR